MGVDVKAFLTEQFPQQARQFVVIIDDEQSSRHLAGTMADMRGRRNSVASFEREPGENSSSEVIHSGVSLSPDDAYALREVFMSETKAVESIRNVVLVHGGFVDGSGWQGVYDLLRKDGYNVSVVQNPTTSLADDVAVTRRALAAQNGPAILVGHSYGGVVITEAGNDPKVARLVYIAAFAPDAGESVSSLIQNPPPGAPVPPILPPQDGFLFLDRTKFRESFAADVSADAAAFMADSQVPWGVEALAGAVGEPAWKTKPSWYLVATEDRMIPPDAQRAMSKRAGSTVTEVSGSHAVYVSQPQAVAAIITKAAHGAARAAR
jgi:pimeloyl-ACP methyl ester carboxylesterase